MIDKQILDVILTSHIYSAYKIHIHIYALYECVYNHTKLKQLFTRQVYLLFNPLNCYRLLYMSLINCNSVP